MIIESANAGYKVGAARDRARGLKYLDFLEFLIIERFTISGISSAFRVHKHPGNPGFGAFLTIHSHTSDEYFMN